MTALSVTLPATFLARDVHLHVEKQGRRWALIAIDAVGNAWPIDQIGGARFASKSFALATLMDHGATEGERIFAQPSVRF